MKTPAQADIQRWSDEVARDPRSLAFLPLARAYRRQGLRDLATQLCLRGLASYPSHAEAHGLLALLYLEAGDHQRAADEWSIVLRIDSDNFEALRGMGFCYLEQDQLSRARHSLERAALLRPTDPAVSEALRLLGTRQELVEQGIAPHGPRFMLDDPWSEQAPSDDDSPGEAAGGAVGAEADADPSVATMEMAAVAPAGPATTGAAGLAAAGDSGPVSWRGEPGGAFDDLLANGPLLGVLLVDVHGLVLAGRLTEAVAGDAALLGAVLGDAVVEAARTVAYLALGNWRGILLESGHALLHVAPSGSDAVVVLVARRNTPAGWMLRTAAQAAERAARYMEAYG
jgi:predicted regulator of Ras-like GTPase activity (Roadblock/LC7/MglB family)